MLIGMRPEYPFLNKSHKKMARCRLCAGVLYGIYDINLRFYGDCCDIMQQHTDVFPKKIPLKVWPST